MRKVTFGLANSLDNYIARKDGGFDWIHWSAEVAKISAKFMKTVDTLLIGRGTYEAMLSYGEASFPGVKNLVFTRSKKKAVTLKKQIASKKAKNVEVIAQDAAVFLEELKKKKGKGIAVFGGGELAKSLFEADLIDEVVLNIHPVILGSGIPLFHEMKRQIDLELLECRVLKGGYLAVSYRVKH
jgi:dihydrofolate reductase